MKKIGALIAFAILGLALGYSLDTRESFKWSRDGQKVDRLPAAEEIPCPDRAAAEKAIKKFKIGFDLKDFTCDENDTRTHFLKALTLAQKMSFTAPAGWDPVFRAIVRDLETWLTRYVVAYEIDTQMADSTIAYYDSEKKKIFMTERIRTFSSLDVFGIVVHENRHAETPGFTHVACDSGDFPQFRGACDETFTDSMKGMGSYNFTILYQLGNSLYNPKLSESEKDILALDALDSLSSRMNHVPGRFGYFQEALAILDEKGQAFAIDPFILDAYTLDVGSPVDHIENSAIALSISLFSRNKKWFLWNLGEGLKNPHKDILKEKNITDAGKMRIYAPLDLRDGFIHNGIIETITIDRETKKKRVTPYTLLTHEGDVMREDLHRIIFGGSVEVLFFTTEGKLLRSRQFGNEPLFKEVNSVSGKWVHGTGGPLYDNFYLTNEKGEVSQVTIRYHEDEVVEPGAEDPKIQFEALEEISKLKPKKYYPGFSAEYVLTQENEMLMRPYSETQFKKIRLNQRPMDFAVFKSFSLDPKVLKSRLSKQAAFEKKCQVRESRLDPWLQKPMGIDHNQNLVMEGPHGECASIRTSGAVLSFTLGSELAAGKKPHTHYGKPVLVIKTAGGEQVLRPYE